MRHKTTILPYNFLARRDVQIIKYKVIYIYIMYKCMLFYFSFYQSTSMVVLNHMHAITDADILQSTVSEDVSTIGS